MVIHLRFSTIAYDLQLHLREAHIDIEDKSSLTKPLEEAFMGDPSNIGEFFLMWDIGFDE